MNALLPLVIGVVALLYASVGHAGATGYIAVMTLFGLEPQAVRPTALVLNVIVAAIATVQFFRAGYFRGRMFLPLAAASMPCAAVGGAIDLPTDIFEPLVGIVLLLAAARIFREPGGESVGDAASRPATARLQATPLLATLGAAIGLLSGLTGVGGGVFLTPALLALDAAPVKQVAAVSAPFILVNSLAGLAGGMMAGGRLTAISLPVIAAVVIGGVAGSQLGAFRLPARALRVLMAVVLALASVKLLARPFGG